MLKGSNRPWQITVDDGIATSTNLVNQLVIQSRDLTPSAERSVGFWAAFSRWERRYCGPAQTRKKANIDYNAKENLESTTESKGTNTRAN
jgi:hypothetical protein